MTLTITSEMELAERQSAMTYWRYLKDNRGDAMHHYHQSRRIMRHLIDIRKKEKEHFFLKPIRWFHFLTDFIMIGMCIKHKKTPIQIAMTFYWIDKMRYLNLEEEILFFEEEYGF